MRGGDVQRAQRDEHTANMLRAAVDLGAALGLKVVAEGVETTEEIELARRVGCDFAQGYFIGRPVRAEALGVLVASWNQSAAKWLAATAPDQTTASWASISA